MADNADNILMLIELNQDDIDTLEWAAGPDNSLGSRTWGGVYYET
jgi:hypothetical protein